MRYVKLIFGALALSICAMISINGIAGALSPPSLFLISEIETTGIDVSGNDVSTEEFVKLTNISGDAIVLDNWRLDYLSASGASVTPLMSLNGIVQPNGSVLAAHSGYPGVTADASFGSGATSILAKSGGQVRLSNNAGAVVDLVGWGSATVPPPWPKLSAISVGYSVKRIIPGHPLFGTGIDYTFTSGTQPMTPTGGAYLPDKCPNLGDIQPFVPDGMMLSGGNCIPVPPPDVCSNIAGDQLEIPVGYGRDEAGACWVDMCLNITGLQQSVPDLYERDLTGDCYQHDECDNLPDIQSEVPEGMVRKGSNDCGLDLVPLALTEILPNVNGSDTDREYVEIYNPSDMIVDLTPYYLRVGVSADKIYSFPSGAKIGPGEYKVFYNSAVNFTLLNTTGRVVLGAIDGAVFGDTGLYDSPGDDMAWALINGTWQYTNQPTPNTLNSPSLITDSIDEPQNSLSLCPAGKYRNPLTNRCRSIETDASVLAACDADQYRNPETGRCRKLADVSAQTPCKDGQYRSEETNRCRNITTASTNLAACKEGQERNPDTNRCRNAAAKSVPDAAFAIKPMEEGAKAFVAWWALGGVGALALGYAGWEWRSEVAGALRKIGSVISRK